MTTDQETGRFIVEQSQKIVELTKRAEAAELALQAETKQRGLDRLAFTQQVMDREREKETLNAALQAKEQELAQLKERCAKEKGEVLLVNVAQARQQAIADLTPYLTHSTLCERAYRDDPTGVKYRCDCGLDEIRSLTPPPALTKEK